MQVACRLPFPQNRKKQLASRIPGDSLNFQEHCNTARDYENNIVIFSQNILEADLVFEH